MLPAGLRLPLTFVIFMVAGVLTLMWRLTEHPPSAASQQIQLGAARFLRLRLLPRISILSDMTKLDDRIVRRAADARDGRGLSFGLAFLSLQLGLMVALLRFRLYDAEFAISRSANIALITLASPPSSPAPPTH